MTALGDDATPTVPKILTLLKRVRVGKGLIKARRGTSRHVESRRVKSSQVESSRVESSQIESNRVESSRVESSRVYE